MVVAWEWSVFSTDHRFLGFWVKCSSAGCSKVDFRLASASTSSLPQMSWCPETQKMTNLIERMILAMDYWRVTMVESVYCGLSVVSTSDLQSQTITTLCQLFSLYSLQSSF